MSLVVNQNKIWVDEGIQVCKRSMKTWLKDNKTEIYQYFEEKENGNK